MRFHYTNNSGYTLIELLVVIGILGILAGLISLNILYFIDTGRDEARDTEGHQVQSAALTYMADGNTIEEPFTVSPDDQGVLDPYLTGNLVYSWTINANGSVELYEEPAEPEAEPGPFVPSKPGPGKLPSKPFQQFN